MVIRNNIPLALVALAALCFAIVLHIAGKEDAAGFSGDAAFFFLIAALGVRGQVFVPGLQPLRWQVKPSLCVATVVGAGLAIPFLQKPNDLLYLRFFDAETYFDAPAKLLRLLQPWDIMQHLGYESSRGLMYITPHQVLVTMLSWLGTNWLIRVDQIMLETLVFASFLFFARTMYPTVPVALCLLAAVFYAVNPIVTMLLHDGYSSLLVQYIIFPAGLVLIDRAIRRRNPIYFLAAAALYGLGGFYNLPLVCIFVGATMLLRFAALRTMLEPRFGLRLPLFFLVAMNAFWILPVAFTAATHSINADYETNADIRATTQAGTISNVLLLRSYPTIEETTPTGERSCTACSFYEAPLYTTTASILVALVVIVLIRERLWLMLALLLSGATFATALRYQGELIGLPYAVLSSTPVLGSIFRGAAKFAMVLPFVYVAAGLEWFRRHPAHIRDVRYIGFVTAVVAIVGWPYFQGGVIEHGHSVNGAVTYPNTIVRIPNAYDHARFTIRASSSSEPVLLLPNMILASYSWGAYGNDFLPAYFGRPTLFESYLKTPNPDVQRDLEILTDPNVSQESIWSLMHVMRIRAAFIHNDVNGAAPINFYRYGSPIFHEGALGITVPRVDPLPLHQMSHTPIYVLGKHEAEARVATFERAVTAPAADFVCPLEHPIAFGDPLTLGSEVAFQIPTVCDTRALAFVRLRSRSSQVRIDFAPRDANLMCGRYTQATVHPIHGDPLHLAGIMHVYASGTCVRLRRQSASFIDLVISKSDQTQSMTWVRDEPIYELWGLLSVRHAEPFATIRTLNVSDDPSIVGVVVGRGGLSIAEKLRANSYANGWIVPSGQQLIVINALMCLYVLGIAVSVSALVAFILATRRLVNSTT